jgi:(p)ppGpp synthase/HD superfamily hydrolase
LNPNDLFAAIQFAMQAHRGQFRKGTSVPYIVHPLAVGRILAEAGCAPEIVLAGFLHDTVEDTPATLDEIQTEFGERVAYLVAAVTESDRSAPWKVRKQETLDKLQVANEDVLALALADKIDNMRSIRTNFQRDGHKIWERFNRPREDQAWYFRSLASCFQTRIQQAPALDYLPEFLRLVEEVFPE